MLIEDDNAAGRRRRRAEIPRRRSAVGGDPSSATRVQAGKAVWGPHRVDDLARAVPQDEPANRGPAPSISVVRDAGTRSARRSADREPT